MQNKWKKQGKTGLNKNDNIHKSKANQKGLYGQLRRRELNIKTYIFYLNFLKTEIENGVDGGRPPSLSPTIFFNFLKESK